MANGAKWSFRLGLRMGGVGWIGLFLDIGGVRYVGVEVRIQVGLRMGGVGWMGLFMGIGGVGDVGVAVTVQVGLKVLCGWEVGWVE